MSNAVSPFRRVFRGTWAFTSTHYEANTDGTCYIALSGQDTSGGVRITPQGGDMMQGQYFLVTPSSPFVGHIVVPYLVSGITNPGYGSFVELPYYSASATTTLDLFLYSYIPPVKVTRSQLVVSGTTGAGGATTIAANILGRNKVRVAVTSNEGVDRTVTITAKMATNTGTASRVLVSAATITATTGSNIWEFGLISASPPDLTGADAVEVTSTGNVGVAIDAWD